MKPGKCTWIMSMVLIVSLAAFPAMAQSTDAASATPDPSKRPGGVKSLEKRVKQLEASFSRKVESDKWYDRIQLSGAIEVEAGHASTDFKDPATEDTSTSDLDLAKVELGIDARIADHVDGFVLFKWEDSVFEVDEGFITLTGTEEIPVYLLTGKLVIPFGYYDSFFVTDPATKVLGETNQGALVGGYRWGGEKLDLSVGAFNGRTKKSSGDDQISNYVAAAVFTPVEALMVGASYTSNLAASDNLNGQIMDPDANGINDLESFVGGWSAFASVSFLDRFRLIGEYVSASDEFKAGELYDPADSVKRKPSAWNLELGMTVTEKWEVAGRYEASSDGDAGAAEFLPETQYGAVVNWGFFDSTNLALEYLHGEFQNDFQKTNVFTAQLAVEF